MQRFKINVHGSMVRGPLISKFTHRLKKIVPIIISIIIMLKLIMLIFPIIVLSKTMEQLCNIFFAVELAGKVND